MREHFKLEYSVNKNSALFILIYMVQILIGTYKSEGINCRFWRFRHRRLITKIRPAAALSIDFFFSRTTVGVLHISRRWLVYDVLKPLSPYVDSACYCLQQLYGVYVTTLFNRYSNITVYDQQVLTPY